MRVVKISGGLGNQMFQYVFGKYLSKKYNEKIYYDVDWYKNLKKRLYNLELLKFDLDIEIIKVKITYLNLLYLIR